MAKSKTDKTLDIAGSNGPRIVSKRIKSKSRKQYLVSDEGGLFLITDKFFDAIQTREHALAVAIKVYDAIMANLIVEAKVGVPMYVGRMKVQTGLESCLNELEKRFPCLIEEVKATTKRFSTGSFSFDN